jgi:hypothetical protein
MSLTLTRDERVLLLTILENHAVDLSDYIRDNDDDYGPLSKAAFLANNQYLEEIRALQSKIFSSI